MSTIKFPDNRGSRFSKDAEKLFIHSGDLYYRAIENADGVPFQLIFGPKLGEGYYLTVGAGIRKLLGIEPEEFSENYFHEKIVSIVPLSVDMPSELSESREKFICGELKSYNAEVLIRMPGGEKKWIYDSSIPLVDPENGSVIGAFGILFDINDRKQTLESLEKSKEKAQESDLLKNAFLRNISHEIRTPLNAIVGFSTLLVENDSGPDKQQEFIDIIYRSTDHLLEIVNDIVEISKIDADTVNIKQEVINLNSSLRRIYDRFRIIAYEKNISLYFVPALEDSEAKIYTDGYKLSQIFTNLMDNALKFIKEGKVEFGYNLKDDNIEFYVSDTGIGIPPEHQARIFNRFYQAESSDIRSFGGTGLGLAIAKAYIELLGGDIWFSSQSGEGSVFYFNLPFDKIT